MLLSRTRMLCLALLLLSFSATLSRAYTHSSTTAESGLTVAVADFSGADKETGRFIADTLLSDLAQSDRLQLVERSEIRQAFTELKLQSTGLTEPQQVQRLGKLVSADRLIVGSYLERGDQILINARLLDVRSGRVASGGGGNVSGIRQDLLALIHRLAHQFHKRVTGSDLILDGEGPPTASPSASSDPLPPVSSTQETHTPSEFLPVGARLNGIVLERELAVLVKRLAHSDNAQPHLALTVMQTNTPVSRLRVLTALVKLTVSADHIAACAVADARSMPPDAAKIPQWGVRYVAAAMEQDWWPNNRLLRPRENATWEFVGLILAKMSSNVPSASGAEQEDSSNDTVVDTGAYTGLIVDATDFSIQRAMSPRILDEDGRVVYPDPKHIPGFDYLEEQGMASYYENVHDAERSGSRPMIVRAIDVAGPGRDDLVVSNETAERIREANRRGKFFSRWTVSILSLSH